MRAVCLQHVPFEGPGVFARHLNARDVTVEKFLVPRDGMPKDSGDLLIVMGGPMSVNDPDSWIAEETAFIRAAMQAKKPVLGICLGSQFMAKALGAQVRPGRALEIGMTPIRLTDDGKKDPVFSQFPDTFEVFEWHGEVFDLPAGCEALAGSAIAPIQAFRYGSRAYGLLFHLEIEQSWIDALCRECPQDVARAGLHRATLIEAARSHLPQLHNRAGTLIDHLLAFPR